MQLSPSTSLPHRKRVFSVGLLLGSLFLVLSPSAQAQITISFVYNGTDTTMTYNVAPGSLSSLAVSVSPTVSTTDEHNVRNGGLVNVTASTMDNYTNPGFSNLVWGTPTVAATSFSGDPIRFFQGSSGVRVRTGFNRATETLAGTMLWTSTSLTQLGFASNFTTSGWFPALGTTVNWSVTSSVIPEPSTYAAMFGLAVLCYSAVVRRRTKRT